MLSDHKHFKIKNMADLSLMTYICIFVRDNLPEIILAHNEIMQMQEAIYPFKESKVRAYNGNKGNAEVIIENPYESKIPTRFLLGMIDTDSYIGKWGKIL